MSANNNSSTSQNVPDSSPSFPGGQILPPAQIRPLEESNMMNFHNTVKKTITFTIGGSLTENRQNTQLINQNMNRIAPNKPQYFSESDPITSANSPPTPKLQSNPQPTPKPTAPPQNPPPSKNSPIMQSIQSQNTTNSSPSIQRQAVPKLASPPIQTASKPLANTTLPTPSQPKALQTSPIVQRQQSALPSNPSTNNNTGNQMQPSTQQRPIQPQPPQMQQQMQYAPPKAIPQPQMNPHMQQQQAQQVPKQNVQPQQIQHQPQQKAPVQRPPSAQVPQQQQQAFYQQPASKPTTAPPQNSLKRPLPQKEYEGLYRERQALYQLQMHTLLQRQHSNYLKHQPDQTMEEINKQIQEIERQYLQQQQKLAELDARLVQQMQQEPGMTVRNPNLAMQHTRLQAAIEDIRQEPPKPATPPKPRGRPIAPFPTSTVPASAAPTSAPLPKKMKKGSSDGEDAVETKIKPTRFNYFGNTPNYELSWLMLGSQIVKDILTQHKSSVPDVSAETLYSAAAEAERLKKAKKLKPNPPATQIKLGNNNSTNTQPAPPQKTTPPPVGTIFIDEKTE